MSRANYHLWTGERKQVVANLLREGKSAGQIATYMEISRSSVIGLVHRDADLKEIGFARSVAHAERKKPSTPKAECSKPKLSVFGKAALAKPEAELSACLVGLPLSELNWDQCRYAVNNAAKGENHLFCGGKVKVSSSFCGHHHSRVFVRPIKAGVK